MTNKKVLIMHIFLYFAYFKLFLLNHSKSQKRIISMKLPIVLHNVNLIPLEPAMVVFTKKDYKCKRIEIILIFGIMLFL